MKRRFLILEQTAAALYVARLLTFGLFIVQGHNPAFGITSNLPRVHKFQQILGGFVVTGHELVMELVVICS